MPYPGVPPGKKTKDMESCISDLMSDKKMQTKYPDHKERKSRAIAICHSSIMGKGGTMRYPLIGKTVWSVAYQNNLPDSSFAYISGGGKKDSSGKTTPRSLRHLPYKDANGKIDSAHVRNALARLNQTQIPASAKASARAKLVAAAKQVGIEVESNSTEVNGKVEGGEDIVIRKTTTTEIVSDEELEKQAEHAGAKDKVSFVDCMKQNMKDGMDMADARKECKTQMKGKAEDGDPVDEPKTEEVTPEVKEEGVVEEPKAEEAVVTEEVAPAEEVVETPVVAPEVPVVEIPAEETPVAQSDKVTDLVKQVLDKIQKLEATLKKQDEPIRQAQGEPEEGDSASTEGAAPEAPVESDSTPVAPEVAPEEPAADAVVEDVAPVTPAEGASPEGAEVAKVYDVVNKIPGQLEKLEKAFDEKFGALETRIKNIEEQPAPSKVVSPQVVTKGGTPSTDSTRLAEINKELAELEEMKKHDIDRFQKERRWDRAFDLIAEKEQLKETEA